MLNFFKTPASDHLPQNTKKILRVCKLFSPRTFAAMATARNNIYMVRLSKDQVMFEIKKNYILLFFRLEVIRHLTTLTLVWRSLN
jgi:hypothetical protein